MTNYFKYKQKSLKLKTIKLIYSNKKQKLFFCIFYYFQIELDYNIQLVVGDRLQINCDFEFQESISWKLPNNHSNYTITNSYDIKSGDEISRLTINKVEQHDTGLYCCKRTNLFVSQDNPLYVTFKYFNVYVFGESTIKFSYFLFNLSKLFDFILIFLNKKN